MVVNQEDDKSRHYRYEVRLLIKHPNIDPNRITETLQLTPHLSAIAGSQRKGPTGKLGYGPHKVSVWSYALDIEGDRLFFKNVVKLIDGMEKHRAFLIEVEKSGGSIELSAALPGDINIGDCLSWRDMGRLADLHVKLGIEVFPESN